MATQNKNVEEAVVEAAEQAATEGKDFIKPKEWDSGKDWNYLNEKQPDASHVLKAEMMNRFGPEGFEITPDQVKVFLAMHRWVQQSDANQSRGDFRGRTWESVTKGYETLVKHAEEAIAEKGPNAVMVDQPHITGVKASDILEQVAQAEEAPEEVKEEAAEAVKEVEEAKAAPAKKPAQRRSPRTPRKTPAKASA